MLPKARTAGFFYLWLHEKFFTRQNNIEKHIAIHNTCYVSQCFLIFYRLQSSLGGGGEVVVEDGENNWKELMIMILKQEFFKENIPGHQNRDLLIQVLKSN